MARTIQVHQIDAFTRIKFTGNPAGVVLDADGLTMRRCWRSRAS